MYRALPWRTMSANACIVSSSGVSLSYRWRLVEVDVVRAESSQRAVDRLHDVLPRQSAVVGALGARRVVHLRQDLQRFAALTLESVAQDLLRLRVRVHVCGVERRDTGLERGVDAFGGDVVLHLGSVGEPVAVGDLGDLEAGVAEVAVFHRTLPF